MGTDPATSKAKPVLAASSRLHTEPDFNQPLRSDTTPFPLLPKQTVPGSEKALRQRCRSASTPSKDERSDPPSSTARRSPLRRHPSASIHNILPLQTFIYEVNLRIFPARGGGGGEFSVHRFPLCRGLIKLRVSGSLQNSLGFCQS